jgi:hypothetical protein
MNWWKWLVRVLLLVRDASTNSWTAINTFTSISWGDTYKRQKNIITIEKVTQMFIMSSRWRFAGGVAVVSVSLLFSTVLRVCGVHLRLNLCWCGA